MATNKIRPGMLSEKIMSAVISCGEIKKYKLRAFAPEASNNGYYKSYQNLLKAGYIQEVTQAWKGYGRANKKNIYVLATSEGRKAFAELYGEDYLKAITPNIAGKENYDRQAKINDVNALLASCDMAYMYGEKPPLIEYLSAEVSPKYIAASMEHGIAYSSKEVKECLKSMHFQGSNIAFDSASGSRFISLLFYKQKVFVLYNTGAKAMLWSTTTEKRLKSVLCRLINESELANAGYIARQSESTLRCIMLCTNKNGLWNLLFQRGYRPIGKEVNGEANQRASVSLKVLTSDYSNTALITSGTNISAQFINALEMSNEAARAEYADKLLTLYPDMSYIKRFNGVVLSDGENTPIFAMPYLDAHFLQQCHESKVQAKYYVPDNTQNVLSVFLKGYALEFYDADTAEKLEISPSFMVAETEENDE